MLAKSYFNVARDKTPLQRQKCLSLSLSPFSHPLFLLCLFASNITRTNWNSSICYVYVYTCNVDMHSSFATLSIQKCSLDFSA